MEFDREVAERAIGKGKPRAIDQVRAAFSKKLVRVDVPEWADTDGVPMAIWFSPITISDMEFVQTTGDRETQSGLEVELFVHKALGEDGRPLFTSADIPILKTETHVTVMTRLMAEILKAGRLPTVTALKETLADPKTDGSAGS